MDRHNGADPHLGNANQGSEHKDAPKLKLESYPTRADPYDTFGNYFNPRPRMAGDTQAIFQTISLSVSIRARAWRAI